MTNSSLYPPTYDNCDDLSDRCNVEFTVLGSPISMALTIVFAALFILLLLIQFWQGIRGKVWSYTIWLSLGTILEIIGYGGRAILSKNPWILNAYIIQFLALLLAPTLVAAAISVTFKHLVIWYGAKWSLLRPTLYPWVFVGTDFISIFVQIVGGGIIAINTSSEGEGPPRELGEGLVIGGVVFQVANMVCCAGLMLIYSRRRSVALRNMAGDTAAEPSLPAYTSGFQGRGKIPMSRIEATYAEARKTRFFIYALGVAYIAIIIRCIYRVFETLPATSRDVTRNQTLFYALDSAMIVLATGVITILHPTICFPFLGTNGKEKREKFDMGRESDMS